MRLNETIDDLKRELSFAKPNSNDTRQEVSQHFLRAQVFVNYRNQFLNFFWFGVSHTVVTKKQNGP